MPAVLHDGRTPSGASYRVAVPDNWNGTLLVHSRPVSVGPDDPPWSPEDQLIAELMRHGFAVGGVANEIFWPLESVFAAVPGLLESFVGRFGRPERTFGFGLSIGGLIVAGLVQRFPGLLDGALAMCGNLAGAVGIHNRELDIAFVVETLLEGGTELQLVDIVDPRDNVGRARAVLANARETPVGRARLALAAAVGNIPSWHDPVVPEPARGDHVARFDQQVAWFEDPGFLVYFGAREQVERQAGGNPSWNAGVDYRELLEGSAVSDLVEALYADAQLGLDDDLSALSEHRRIEADPDAVRYLERHIVLDGNLRDTPVLTLHTDGDGLVTPDNETAYADVVSSAGQGGLLRQLYVHRGGHCDFTLAEVLTGLAVLDARLDRGEWPDLDPDRVNAAAASLGGRNVLSSGHRREPGFLAFEPLPFPRRYDARDMTTDPGRVRLNDG